MVAGDAVRQPHAQPAVAVTPRKIEILAVEEVAGIEAAKTPELVSANEEQGGGRPHVLYRPGRPRRALTLVWPEMRPRLTQDNSEPRAVPEDLVLRGGLRQPRQEGNEQAKAWL